MSGLEIKLVKGLYGIMRLPADHAVPDWFEGTSGFRLCARTPAELTILLPQAEVPEGFPGRQELGWRAMFLAGTLDFGLIGIMASLSSTLAEAKVSILAISTFDTDWLFVKETDLERGLVALESAGVAVIR